MPIYAENNLYPGINAHLNSYLQNEPGAWESFHNDHVTNLREFLDQNLPAGYVTLSEKSLQISEITPPAGMRIRRTQPDVTIFKLPHNTPPAAQASSLTAAAPVATLPLTEIVAEEDYLTGLVIYQVGEGGPLGRPITRIELLSPANLPSGSHYQQYMEKRWQTLRSGIRLVEIDYLHQKAPILNALASYPKGEDEAFPYTILVSDPRPTFERGSSQIYGFGVVDKIPVVSIPLAGADFVLFDFGAVYDYTFTRTRYMHVLVDYAQEPPHFEQYTEADQTRIRELLADIRTRQEE